MFTMSNWDYAFRILAAATIGFILGRNWILLVEYAESLQ